MLKIFTNSINSQEKKYILDFIFHNYFGINYSIIFDEEVLGFKVFYKDEVDPIAFGAGFFCLDITKYLSGEKESFKKEQNFDLLYQDLFGSVFYYITCFEEYLSCSRDKHDRVLVDNDFFDRPIADELLERFWQDLSSKWPSLKREDKAFKIFTTCDVDTPFLNSSRSIKTTIKKMVGDVIRRKSLKECSLTLFRYFDYKLGTYFLDPYYQSIFYIMKKNEEKGLRAAFYFICDSKNLELDATYKITDKNIEKLMLEIIKRGHEIGIHGSYETYKDRDQYEKEFISLRDQLIELGINNPVIGGRQHYLRWDPRVTPNIMNDVGQVYDTTLGYAERAGFRCGTSHEFHMYDLSARRKLNLIQRPLILMESSVIFKSYMNYGYTDKALEFMLNLKSKCKNSHGMFTLLWHNSHFTSSEDKKFYEKLLS